MRDWIIALATLAVGTYVLIYAFLWYFSDTPPIAILGG